MNMLIGMAPNEFALALRRNFKTFCRNCCWFKIIHSLFILLFGVIRWNKSRIELTRPEKISHCYLIRPVSG